ncbi:hypothetical protein GCM10010339_66630 [Streptomyces alanosinicus]|uniref:Uncharacterized protein n=1 Tax=Streptomyces alanosinicus TaxID=68171 RepID=A0A918YP66_9ACTN|nr:hypothetical protein GCM10010339_66630 [Streptomyces alanosinicus]
MAAEDSAEADTTEGDSAGTTTAAGWATTITAAGRATTAITTSTAGTHRASPGSPFPGVTGPQAMPLEETPGAWH